MQLLFILHFRLSTNCPFKWKTTSALWSIIAWSHFYFISCLRQLFYWTQIDDLFRFVINQLCPAVIRFVSIFFLGSFIFSSWKDILKDRIFGWNSSVGDPCTWFHLSVISLIRTYDVDFIDFVIFSFFSGIRLAYFDFCVIMGRSLALKYYFGFKIFFFGIDKWKCIESFLQQLNS